MENKKNIKEFDNLKIKTKVRQLIVKSKNLNLIQPLSSAFDNNPVKEEEHKGNLKSYLERNTEYEKH